MRYASRLVGSSGETSFVSVPSADAGNRFSRGGGGVAPVRVCSELEPGEYATGRSPAFPGNSISRSNSSGCEESTTPSSGVSSSVSPDTSSSAGSGKKWRLSAVPGTAVPPFVSSAPPFSSSPNPMVSRKWPLARSDAEDSSECRVMS